MLPGRIRISVLTLRKAVKFPKQVVILLREDKQDTWSSAAERILPAWCQVTPFLVSWPQ